MPEDIAVTFARLFDKDHTAAYKALQELQRESEATDRVYAYLDRLSDMLDSGSSYIRTRGLTLIAWNARWDREGKINADICRYLRHITDAKPITARQCIKLLPMIARYKPELRAEIVSALEGADISRYADSMQRLILQDIRQALTEIGEL